LNSHPAGTLHTRSRPITSPSNVEPYAVQSQGLSEFSATLWEPAGRRVCCGFYHVSVGYPDYEGEFMPKIHPKQLLAEVIRRNPKMEATKAECHSDGSVHFHKIRCQSARFMLAQGQLFLQRSTENSAGSKKQRKATGIVMHGGLIEKGRHPWRDASLAQHGKWVTPTHGQMAIPTRRKNVQDFYSGGARSGPYNSNHGQRGRRAFIVSVRWLRRPGGCVLDITNAPLQVQRERTRGKYFFGVSGKDDACSAPKKIWLAHEACKKA